MAAILDIEENGSKVIAKVEEKKSLLPDDFLRVLSSITLAMEGFEYGIGSWLVS